MMTYLPVEVTMVLSASFTPVLNLASARLSSCVPHLAGVKATGSSMYAMCSGLICSRRGTGLLSAGKLRSKPREPL